MATPRVLVAVAALAAARLPAQQPADSAPARVVIPAADQARGVDAELRSALFELAADQPLAALSRLEWLRTLLAQSSAADSAALVRPRGDVLFLLAECYYRLGMSDAFRTTAGTLTATPGTERYGGIIQSQLMLDAYRRGEYARVRELTTGPAAGGDRALTTLVAGLAAYQTGDFAAATTAFAGVRAGGGVYAPYAQYMEALAVLQGDSTRAPQALEALRPLAGIATGTFGDHVRLTAAELAYESGQYDAAASFADGVAPASGLGARALLTKGWALYHAGQLDSARAAFDAFATRYPMLPERDEARLMVGQVMLESGHTDDATRYFQTMADSVGLEVTALQSRAAAALTDAARALVAARMAGIAFVALPGDGKTLALPDAAGADPATVLAAFAGSMAPPATQPPAIVSLADVHGQVDSIAPTLGAGFPQRLLFTGVSTPENAAAYATRAQALLEADVSASLAQYRLQEQLDAHAAKIAALEELGRLITTSTEELAVNAKILAATQDSLTAMKAVIDRSRARVREALAARIEAARRTATENLAMIDSLRTALSASAEPSEMAALDTEQQTATTYLHLAETAAAQLDAAIDRHPVFALRDSLGARLARAGALHDEAQAVLASDDQVVKSALAELRGAEPERTRALRATLAGAQSHRTAAEGELIALLDRELTARATAAVGQLQHDREVADYGSASAAFFRATETDAARATPAARSATQSGGDAGTASRTPSPRGPNRPRE
jgi:TolA-binding protein